MNALTAAPAPVPDPVPDPERSAVRRPAYPPTWYADAVPLPPPRPPLAGRRRVGTAVVGAGLAGLAAALTLAEAGHEVAVIEARRVGWGATGRNGGQLVPGYNPDIAALVAAFGETRARALIDLAESGRRLIAGWVERHAIDCGLAWGYCHAAIRQRHLAALAADAERWRRFGYPGQELWDRARVQAAIGSGRYLGGLFDPRGGHVNPLALALGLAAAAEAAGARIHEDSPATHIDLAAGDVVTPGGRLAADHIVIAGDAYLGTLLPALGQRVMPMVSCMVATEPLGASGAGILPGNLAVADTANILDYFRRSADGRLLFGGLARYDATEPPDIAAALRPNLERVFPQLAGIGISHAWSGRITLTRNRLPEVGRIGARGLFAQGWSGHGLILANLGGHLVARAILGDDAGFATLAALEHRRMPAGFLRKVALITATGYYRLIDWV